MSFRLNNITIGAFDTIYLKKPNNDTTSFSIVGIKPSFNKRSYYDELIVFSSKGELTLVNKVDLEHYLIGVLESEVGLNQTKDFYKVHSIISRTYALKNQYKFIHEGFNLTDLVNCQVYKGKMYNHKNIIEAVKETRNLILVDENMDYITDNMLKNLLLQGSNSIPCLIKQIHFNLP